MRAVPGDSQCAWVMAKRCVPFGMSKSTPAGGGDEFLFWFPLENFYLDGRAAWVHAVLEGGPSGPTKAWEVNGHTRLL